MCVLLVSTCPCPNETEAETWRCQDWPRPECEAGEERETGSTGRGTHRHHGESPAERFLHLQLRGGAFSGEERVLLHEVLALPPRAAEQKRRRELANVSSLTRSVWAFGSVYLLGVPSFTMSPSSRLSAELIHRTIGRTFVCCDLQQQKCEKGFILVGVSFSVSPTRRLAPLLFLCATFECFKKWTVFLKRALI